MRPYLIPKTNRWVDLDTIQEIREPVFLDRLGYGGYFISLTWRHAFQDKDHEQLFNQDSHRWHDDRGNSHVEPRKDELGRPDQLAVIREEVFKPFLAAWQQPRPDALSRLASELTLRDLLAGAALSGLLASPSPAFRANRAAELAYELADEMRVVRARLEEVTRG